MHKNKIAPQSGVIDADKRINLNGPPDGTAKDEKERPAIRTTIKENFNFFAFFGKFLGWECKYEWKSNPRHWLTTIDIIFVWYHEIYSQVEHFINGSYGRIFEIFACYGISVSVI